MFDIIDFHTHPFLNDRENFCQHNDVLKMTAKEFAEDMKSHGVSHFCGSVLELGLTIEGMWNSNKVALQLRDLHGDAYIPGIHVHPEYVEESCRQIDMAVKEGVNLIGELVPYLYHWKGDYTSDGLSQILDYSEKYDMTVSVHGMDHDAMEKMAKAHPHINFVIAHPGDKPGVLRSIDIMHNCDNISLDLSGTGLFRYGMLKKLVESTSADRILFGTDYPICNVGMYIAGVMSEKISDDAKEKIFSKNARRLLKLKD